MPTSATPIDLNTQSTQEPQKRVRRTKAQWKKLLEEYAISDLTQTKFCQMHHIATSSLWKWQKYFASQPVASDFIDITESLAKTPSPDSDSPRDDHWQVELALGQGVILRVRAI
ncbi:MAG: hypothetical protein PVI97_15980 [Candidatus Thiodiazotropha sp.]|jgi:hypothetical protein